MPKEKPTNYQDGVWELKTEEQGWVHGLKKIGNGLYRVPTMGNYTELEVELAQAAEMSPRTLRTYAVEMIDKLGLKEEVRKALLK